MKRAVQWVETVFDTSYLLFAAVAGVYLFATSNGNPLRILYGGMAALLVLGDSFHLIPRILSFFKPESSMIMYARALGKGAASITMTLFYVILYYVLIGYYQLPMTAPLMAGIWVLAALRIALCLYPVSQWTGHGKGIVFPVLRNIPFVLLGILVMVLSLQHKVGMADVFSSLWLAILLSFSFYIPVVLLADKYPRVGMLMLPKTCMYVWMICMGLAL